MQQMRKDMEEEKKKEIVEEMKISHNEAIQQMKEAMEEEKEKAIKEEIVSEEMKRSHEAAMQQMKKAMEEVKEKEIKQKRVVEEMRKSHEEAMQEIQKAMEEEKERAMNDKRIVEEMKRSHEEAMQQMKKAMKEEKERAIKEVMDKASSDIESIKAEVENRVKEAAAQKEVEYSSEIETSKIQTLEDEYESTIQKLKLSYEDVLDKERKTNAYTNRIFEETRNKHKVEIEELKQQHREILEQLRVESSMEKAAAINALKEESKHTTKNLEKMHGVTIKSFLAQAKEKYDADLRENTKPYVDKIVELEEAYLNMQQSLNKSVAKYKQEKQELIEEFNWELRNMKAEMSNESEMRIERIRSELSESYEAEIARCKEQASYDLQIACEDATFAAEASMKKALDKVAKQHMYENETLCIEALRELKNMETDFNQWHEKQVESMVSDHKSNVKEVIRVQSIKYERELSNLEDLYYKEIFNQKSDLESKVRQNLELASKIEYLESVIEQERQNTTMLKSNYDAILQTSGKENSSIERKMKDAIDTYERKQEILLSKLKESKKAMIIEKESSDLNREELVTSLENSHKSEMDTMIKSLNEQSQDAIASMKAEHEVEMMKISMELDDRNKEIEDSNLRIDSLQRALEKRNNETINLKANLDVASVTMNGSQTTNLNSGVDSFQEEVELLKSKLQEVEMKTSLEKEKLNQQICELNTQIASDQHNGVDSPVFNGSSAFVAKTRKGKYADSSFQVNGALGQINDTDSSFDTSNPIENADDSLKTTEIDLIAAEAMAAIKQAEEAIEVASERMNPEDLKLYEARKVERLELALDGMELKEVEKTVDWLVTNGGKAASVLQQKALDWLRGNVLTANSALQTKPINEEKDITKEEVKSKSESTIKTPPNKLFFAKQKDD